MNGSCGWSSDISEFNEAETFLIMDSVENFVRDYSQEQLAAWREEISILRNVASKLVASNAFSREYGIILEYRLPYENRRPDVIVLAKDTVIVLEFKSKSHATQADLDQVGAYARDLRAYHKECHERNVLPVLVLTSAQDTQTVTDGITILSPDKLSELISQLAESLGIHQLSVATFLSNDAYRPLPTLVQAARELFQSGSVREIWRASSVTDPAVEAIASIAEEAARTKTRHLVLITGVPGSGKTLVGMRSVHSRLLDKLAVARTDGKPTVPGLYLTGNGPLSEVLQYALRKAGGGGRTFVRHIKGYLDRYVGHLGRIPAEHLLVFDEAQRAFSPARVADTHKDWEIEWIASEPQLFVQICDRMPDWSVLVGLIGSGQEIHVGEEEGLTQWRKALETSPNQWTIHSPKHLEGIFSGSPLPALYEETLNLEVEIRFHHTQRLHEFVEKMLSNGQPKDACTIAESIFRPDGRESDGLKLYVTRDLEVGKRYLLERYSEYPEARFGIVASSRDKELKNWGVNNDFMSTQRLKLGPWFTEGDEDPKSCRILDQSATEFGCQGLELDMALLAWGTDFLRNDGAWTNHDAKRYRRQGRTEVKDPFQMRVNAYRVLLTRGRDGSIIFVPQLADLDETYDFFLQCGIRELNG